MPKKEFRGPGKGMKPTTGYNHKKWNKNFDEIVWDIHKVSIPTNPIVKELAEKILYDRQNT